MAAVTGRINGLGVSRPGISAQDNPCRRPLPISMLEGWWGFALKFNRFPTQGGATHLINNSLTKIVSGSITSAGRFNVGGAAGIQPMFTNTWHFLEVYFKIAGASSKIQTWLDGGPDIPLTTVNLGTVPITQVELNCDDHGGAEFDYDDLYLADPNGSLNNSRIGDVHIETLYPIGDGSHSDFVPNAGTTHYTQVDDPNANDADTTYLSSNVVGAIDTWDYGNLAFVTGQIFAVQVNMLSRKDDSAFRQLAAVTRLGGSDYVSANAKTLPAVYSDSSDILEINPATGVQWTTTDVNAAQWGAKIVS
jgi:hypothetical protein